MSKHVSFLLHMYQPPWQYADVLKRISGECYEWLTEWLADNKRSFKATVNINYSLTELLLKNGLEIIIENIGRGVEKGSIELTGSAAYHPILPLIPEDEVKRQIELNDRKHAEIFKGVWNPRGFFPPEMAYSPRLSRIVREMGYEWIITDDVIYRANNQGAPPNNYIVETNSLPLFFRSRLWSNEFALGMPGRADTDAIGFIKKVSDSRQDNSYCILAFDIETIGHHHKENPYNKDTMDSLENAMQDNKVGSVYVSQLLDKFPERREVKIGEGSWSTTEENIWRGVPFPLWKDPDNEIHWTLWQLVYHTINIVSKSKGVEGYEKARDLLDRGLNSCPFWWASTYRWNSEYILDGSKDLYESVASIPSVSPEDKAKTKLIYQELKDEVSSIKK